MSYIGSKPANKPITSADIEDSIIVAADLAANSVDSSELVDGGIDTSHLSADAVTAAKLADDAVVTANIVDLNVTTAKIAADAITGAKIADDAIGAEHIDDNAVGLAAMASGTDGNVISYDASGNPVAIATGSDGQVLTSAGAGQPPAFENAPSFDADAAQVFNESGADVDFRVESANDSNMLFVDGGKDAVGINCTPDIYDTNSGSDISDAVYKFQVEGGGTAKIGIGSSGTGNTYIGFAGINGSSKPVNIGRIEGQMDTATAGSEAGVIEVYTATGGASAISTTFESNKDVTIESGNLVIGTSGKGIDFSATSDGTTMSSELLDDYEEGTWNPTITDNSNSASGYSEQAGNYIKIGTLVFASGVVQASNLGSVGTVRIGGLPFASKAAGEYTYYHGSPNFMNMKADVDDDAGMHLGNNITYIDVYRNYNKTGPHHIMDTTTEVDTGTSLRFNMTYVSA